MAVRRTAPALAALRPVGAGGSRSRAAMAELARLARESSDQQLVEESSTAGGSMASRSTDSKQEAARVSALLTHQLSTEWSAFGANDVVRIAGVFGRLVHRHPPLLEAVATHTLRGLKVYPLFALCNIVNSFARLDYHHRPLFEAIAGHLADPSRSEQLSPIDISSLVFAYAQLALRRVGGLLEACSTRLKRVHAEVDGPNCAIILNSYARLNECDPELFHVLARSVVQTQPGSFAVHNISVIMNAFAKCQIRKPQLMHLLAGYLEGRLDEMSPQNVSNVSHAFARLECYDQQLFYSVQHRLLKEDLGRYKLYELANLVHSLAKLRCGGKKLYKVLFAEVAVRAGVAAASRATEWEPRSVVQVLDAMRRKQAVFWDEALLSRLIILFVEKMQDYEVQQLTQAAWCLVELDALDLVVNVPHELLPVQGDESAARCIMRFVLERMEQLSQDTPFTTTQRCYVQQLVRAYHYKHELDYGLQPSRTKMFCRSMFDVSTTVVSAMARRPPPPPRQQARLR